MRYWSVWQWLTLVGVILMAGVSVTVFAFQTFDAKGSADAVQTSLEKKIDRIDRNLIRIMIKQKIEPVADSTS
jgi:hypothetical protein